MGGILWSAVVGTRAPQSKEELKGESGAWGTGIELRLLRGGLPRGPVSSHVAPESDSKLSVVLSPALFPPLKTGSHCIAQGGLNFTIVAQTGLELAIILT